MAMNTKHGWLAPIYFISFVVMTAFIIVNLLVAAILENLQVHSYSQRAHFAHSRTFMR